MVEGGQQITVDPSGVRRRGEVVALAAPDGHDHDLGLARPVPVDGGLAGMGVFGERIHAQAVVADFHQQGEGGIEDGLTPGCGPRPGGSTLTLDSLRLGDDHAIPLDLERNRSVLFTLERPGNETQPFRSVLCK